jgi:hypothetical protein
MVLLNYKDVLPLSLSVFFQLPDTENLLLNVDLRSDFNPWHSKDFIKQMRRILLKQNISYMLTYSQKGLQNYLSTKDSSGMLDFSVLYQTSLLAT